MITLRNIKTFQFLNKYENISFILNYIFITGGELEISLKVKYVLEKK